MSTDSLDSFEIALCARGPSPSRRLDGLSSQNIASAAEFAALRWFWWREYKEDLFEVSGIDSWPALAVFRDLASKFGIMRPKARPAGSWFGFRGHAGVHELYPLVSGDWDPGGTFISFQERFRGALRSRGVGPGLSSALAAALKEMASNAVEHSASPIPPIATFGVGEDEWCFSVTDLGRGALVSLRDNPVYSSIATENRALKLVLQDGVSRTGEPGRGRGFTWVFKALVDRQSKLRFRSGGASARWEGTSPTAQDVTYQSLSVTRSGFHVRVMGPL